MAVCRPTGEAPVTPSLSTLLRVLTVPACLALAGPVAAQSATPAPPAAAKPAATAPAAKPAAPAAQRGACAQNPQAQGCPRGQGQARNRAVPPPTTPQEIAALPDADADQMAASELVHYGKYVCDDKYEVFVERNAKATGYVDVRYQKDIWVMKPVASRTGAVRLEDIRGHTLLVQIPAKSMLLNTRTGQRIVDSCQHDAQRTPESQARSESPLVKQ
jgi:hypothetical protein